MKVLIVGPSGAGKTYLSNELKKLGLNSVDADIIGPLSSWFYGDEKVKYQENADKEWLDNHSFLWDKDYLKHYLNENPDIHLLGASGNVFEMLDLFDKVYYLNVPDEVQDERLQHETRENPMGNTEYQRKNAIEWGHELRDKAKDLGIEFIDATSSPEEIYRQLKAGK
jgi:dephospho-CoA kinase